MILCLETATDLCSVALCERSGVIAIRESDKGRSHASLLTVFIQDLLNETGIRAGDLDAVVVSKGPGSYTGLRIGVSAGKGIAYAASVPLIGVDTTLSMFYGFMEIHAEKYGLEGTDLFCPSLDARRMEIYYSLFDVHGDAIRSIRAEIMDKNSFSDIPETSRIIFFGDGAIKCRDVITRSNILFDADFRISASFMQKPAYEALNQHRFEDVAYFEPFYLKDFLTSKPVKNLSGK
ncbi:MAG: tRNA (adenosine(37)-N6)-threonylcarbamoyltransferase complex dimerization subunit type 1 TsaB [Bacteroidales bacterium]|jgi:tRNA threonylcarbamoyladenosine biosynthesis protein TsaB|nr:tRNA (adenosine(37)-N6)-threonylcarbamoyltransferase complex dimerization subunit type 1 TsaB [Bacteroidales bacterium]